MPSLFSELVQTEGKRKRCDGKYHNMARHGRGDASGTFLFFFLPSVFLFITLRGMSAMKLQPREEDLKWDKDRSFSTSVQLT